MTCNCISEGREKVLEQLKIQHPGAIISDVNFQNTAFVLSEQNVLTMKSYDEIGYKIQPLKKDGTHSGIRKKTISLLHRFCPHCGKPQQPSTT